ncbi:MAG TPA: transaldolase family protein [Ktedonobacterales bacterium]|nr:transaldolase family protein [Ktedonobacterales bacterium]
MALYVDSADVAEIAQLCAAYPVAGVTTNPSILLAAIERGQRLRDLELVRELLTVCDGLVFMQPTAETAEALIAAGMRYVDQDSARVVLKLPMTAMGTRAALTLKRQGVRFAFTAVASLAQAYTGSLVGADWVIPYFCRMRRAGIDAADRVAGMARLLTNQTKVCHILAASLKSPADVVEATLAGAHDATLPPEVLRAMAEDPLTQAAVTQFAADWRRAGELLG